MARPSATVLMTINFFSRMADKASAKIAWSSAMRRRGGDALVWTVSIEQPLASFRFGAKSEVDPHGRNNLIKDARNTKPV